MKFAFVCKERITKDVLVHTARFTFGSSMANYKVTYQLIGIGESRTFPFMAERTDDFDVLARIVEHMNTSETQADGLRSVRGYGIRGRVVDVSWVKSDYGISFARYSCDGGREIPI